MAFTSLGVTSSSVAAEFSTILTLRHPGIGKNSQIWSSNGEDVTQTVGILCEDDLTGDRTVFLRDDSKLIRKLDIFWDILFRKVRKQQTQVPPCWNRHEIDIWRNCEWWGMIDSRKKSHNPAKRPRIYNNVNSGMLDVVNKPWFLNLQFDGRKLHLNSDKFLSNLLNRLVYVRGLHSLKQIHLVLPLWTNGYSASITSSIGTIGLMAQINVVRFQKRRECSRAIGMYDGTLMRLPTLGVQ